MDQDGLPFGPEGHATIQIVPDTGSHHSQEDRVNYKSLLATPYDAAERAPLAITLDDRHTTIVSTEIKPFRPDSDGEQFAASQLTGLQTKVKQQSIAIERLNGALQEKEAALASMYKSKSWRITSWFRKIAAVGKK